MSTVKGLLAVVRWRNNGRVEAVGLYDTEEDARIITRTFGPGAELIAIVPVEVPYTETKKVDA